MDEYGAMVERYWQGKTEDLGEKPVPVPLCPPQIPHSDPNANSGLRGDTPATNRLSHGTALQRKYMKKKWTYLLEVWSVFRKISAPNIPAEG
jgi:hypothetical protein